MRGKTIAVNALNGLAVLLTDNVLASHGVPVSDVHYVPVPFPAMASALAAHRVDAAFIAEPRCQQPSSGSGAVPLFDVNQGATQNFPISGYVVTRAWMANTRRRPPRSRRAGTGPADRRDRPGRRRAGADPDTTVSKHTAAVMALGTFPLSVSPVALGRVADLMQSNGLLAKPVNTAALVKELVTR